MASTMINPTVLDETSTFDASSFFTTTEENLNGTYQQYYDDYQDYIDYLHSLWQTKASRILMLYISPILIILGTIGNLLVFVVLQSTLFRKTSCSFLLSALALVDIGVLNTVLLRFWIQELTSPRFDVRTISDAGCRIHVFCTYLFPQLSSWTLVLINIDRIISVVRPLTARQICSKQRMVVAWVIMCVLLAAVNVRVFAQFKLIHYTEHGVDAYGCVTKEEHKKNFRDTHNWVDFSFLCLIPMIIIIGSNAIIIAQMLKAKIRRSASLNARHARPGHARRSENRLSTATMILVVLSIVFVVTTLPRCVYFLGLPWPRDTDEKLIKVDFFYKTCILMYCMSNAGNFLLYCVSGSRFRQAIMNILRGKDFPSLRRKLSRGGSLFSSRRTQTSMTGSGGSKRHKIKMQSQTSTTSNSITLPRDAQRDYIQIEQPNEPAVVISDSAL